MKKGNGLPFPFSFQPSGQKDSNLRPPAPKAGALAGLRHTPKKKTMQPSSSFFRGEGGIRTPGTHCWIRQFSKLLVSATHPPLLGCELRCKNRLFSVTNKHFLSLFLSFLFYTLNHNKIENQIVSKKKKGTACTVPFLNIAKGSYFSVRSTISASGAFFCTEAMPFFMFTLFAYIWLEPMIWPLVAIRLK